MTMFCKPLVNDIFVIFPRNKQQMYKHRTIDQQTFKETYALNEISFRVGTLSIASKTDIHIFLSAIILSAL